MQLTKWLRTKYTVQAIAFSDGFLVARCAEEDLPKVATLWKDNGWHVRIAAFNEAGQCVGTWEEGRAIPEHLFREYQEEDKRS